MILVLLAQIFSSSLELISLNAAAIFISSIVDPSIIEGSDLFQSFSDWIGVSIEAPLVVYFGALTIILLVFGFVLNYSVQYVGEYVGYRISIHLTQKAVRAMVHAPYQWFLRQNASEVSQKLFADGSSIGGALLPSVLELLYSSLLVFVSIIMIVYALSANSVVVVFCIALIAAFILAALKPLISRFSVRQRSSTIECNRAGVELVRGAKEIKIKGRSEFYLNGFMTPFKYWGFNRLLLNLLQRATPLILMLLGQVGLIAITLALYTSDISKGQLTAQVAFLGIVVSRLLPAISRASGNVTKIASVTPYVSAYLDFMSEMEKFGQSDLRKPRGTIPAEWRSIELVDVDFSYDASERNVLKGVSLQLEKNKSYGFVGRSGSGKTTLVDLLIGLHVPKSGTMKLDNLNFSELNIAAWQRKVGYVSQAPFISDDTLLRNVAIGLDQRDIDEAKAIKCLAVAGLSKTVEGLPLGIHTRVGDAGLRLSGGQRQRIAIARALYDEPDIIVLDEATSALDVLTEQAVLEAMHRLKGRVTLVMIAHRLSTLRSCDKLVLLDEGRVVASGSWDELSARSDLFQGMEKLME